MRYIIAKSIYRLDILIVSLSRNNNNEYVYISSENSYS